MIRKTILVFLFLILSCIYIKAQVTLVNRASTKNDFPLISSSSQATLLFDSQDESVVKTSVSLFIDDVERVSGKKIRSITETHQSKVGDYAVIVGTIGTSKWVDNLVKKKSIDITSIVNGWEQYSIQLVDKPMSGVKKAIVIAGSDKRGTAYGLLSLSRAIGVSPWYWWADAPIKKQKQLALNVNNYNSKEPSVKYRGIFINDEDWGIYRWSKNNFEKDLGNMGPQTYEKICELLLRLQANYLAPAMHDATMAFHRIPENREVANRYAIVMGSSHCEPLLFNTASEWNKEKMGNWDYVNNKEGVNKTLRNRVVEAAPYENVYTLALRGLHDKAMEGSHDMAERKNTMQEALLAQRAIVSDVVGMPANEIPQAFTPYKEVLDVYDQGLELPDDVTIIWPDDNYGYMKRLSSPKEQKRSGRSGVYYHASYLGKPHDYLWMNTTSPTLMYEELRKAYDATADRIWLLNAGDIKACEFAVDFFLEMAYSINSFDYNRVSKYHAEWLSSMLGDKFISDFQDISSSFYHLSFARKPEFMGWGYQWATNKHGNERNTDTDFSFVNYREVDTRLREYERIANKSELIMNQLPEEYKACFYQTLYYPVKASELLNNMVLNGQKNRWYATQQRAATKALADQVKVYYDSLDVITKGYNELLDGKWNHMMTMKQGFASSYFKMPTLRDAVLESEAKLGVMAEGETVLKGGKSFHALPSFNTYLRKSYFIDVFNKGTAALEWTASAEDKWLILSRTKGKTNTEDRIEVSVDWNKAPKGERIKGAVTINSKNGDREDILISVFNPSTPSREDIAGLFIQDNGHISIDAASFHRKNENEVIKIKLIPNLGFENTAVQLGDPISPRQNTKASNAPSVEYDFYTFEQGSVDVYTYVLPTFAISRDREYAGHESTNVETQYGVSIDDGPVMNPSTSSFEYAQIWYESVLKNCRVNKTTLHIDKPGKHTLKIICGDAGTIFQKAVLDFGGMKRSYQGPSSTLSKL